MKIRLALAFPFYLAGIVLVMFAQIVEGTFDWKKTL
jgi:hypothetical protein